MKDLLVSVALVATVALGTAAAQAGEIDKGLVTVLEESDRNEVVSVILYLWDQGNIEELIRALDEERAPRSVRNEEVVRVLRDTAHATQQQLLHRLGQLQTRGRIQQLQPFWLVNAIRMDATGDVILELAEHPDVKRVYFNPPIESVAPIEVDQHEHGPHQTAAGSSSMLPGLEAIRAPEAWSHGYTGAGVLVASLDTGVSGQHPAVDGRWRGHHPQYQGNPQWAWFDPVTQTTSPQEFASNSHGTHTMGTIVGGYPGETIGVAPGAEWIHAAVIDRVNIQTTVADAIAAFQWMVDPDGDPSTHWDVPHVCSNSWGLRTSHGYPECDTLFWSFIDNAEAAGVLMLFAAGNEGSSGLRRPADRAIDDFRSVAVGSINPHNSSFPVSAFSSRGPTTCTPDGSLAVKPDLAAPGTAIYSAVAGGGYMEYSGTSMAAPHVAGVVAMIYQVCPELPVDEAKQILFDTALDLGTAGKNNQTGWGLIDAMAAVALAEATCDFIIKLPNGVPESIDPGIPTSIVVEITDVNDPVVPGLVTLHYRTDGGPFIATPLTHLGGEMYLASLPAMSCDDSPEFYFSAMGESGSVRTNPPQAPQQFYSTDVGIMLDSATIDHTFVDGLPDGWTMTGLWTITDACAVEGDCANTHWAYYGIPSTCRYQTGFNANSGSMISSPISIPVVEDDQEVTLSFCYTLQTEENFTFDRARFYINGQLIKQFHDSEQWTTYTLDMTGYAGSTVTLEWNFNTIDGNVNWYRGWQIDQVRIVSPQFVCEDATPTCPPDLNGSGHVDGGDLLILLGQWGPCAAAPSQCSADFNSDGSVDGLDLLKLLSEWGPCP